MIEEKNFNVIQNIILENREKLSISGVKDVLSSDDKMVIVQTELGFPTIKGDNIRINKLSLDSLDIAIDGTINSLNYSTSSDSGGKKNSGILNKIFK